MATCKYCNSQNVKWINIAEKGDPDKWELWTTELGRVMWKHDCGFRGLGSCRSCGEPVRWKEVFCTVKGYTFKPYHHTKNKEEHTCAWRKIKHLPKGQRPNYLK